MVPQIAPATSERHTAHAETCPQTISIPLRLPTMEREVFNMSPANTDIMPFTRNWMWAVNIRRGYGAADTVSPQSRPASTIRAPFPVR